jgi:FixJ family two-component response regulator
VYVIDDDQACRELIVHLLASVRLPALGFATGRGFLDAYDADRASCAVIAEEMGLSMKTVEYHRGHGMRKMAVASVAELVRQVLAAEAV